jgi:myo-inositol-1(or 4)-monophosphatase
MDLKKMCQAMEDVAIEAAQFITQEAKRFEPGMTEKKGKNDFVSYVDREAEKIIVDKLGLLLPEAGFKVEENTSSKIGERYCWVVDPLDGTANFIQGIHPYAVSIGLTDGEEIIAGVVAEAAGTELFKAWKDGGAWLNGERITVSATSSAADSFVATGLPYSDFSRLTEYMKCLDHLLKNTRGVRRLGAASVDLAYVAAGRFDMFFEYGLKPWDVAAGTILITEAGGIVGDFSGKRKGMICNDIIATNGIVFNEMVEIISKFMVK